MSKSKKSIFKSKTFWINLLMGVGAILPELVGLGIELPIKYVATTMVIVNLILRLITTESVHVIKKRI